MVSYKHPPSLARSGAYVLHVNGRPVEILSTGVAEFAIAALEESDLPAQVEVRIPRDAQDAIRKT